MLLNRHGSSQHKLGSKFSYSDLYPMYANGRAWELKIPWLVVRVHSSGNFRWWNERLVWWWNQTACASHPKRILRILGLEAWVARWIWSNDLTMSGGIGIHGCFKYNCLWHEGSIPSSWTNFKKMVPTEFCFKTEVDAGSRKPMEGRTRIRLSILERTIWRNQRTETQISVPATS